MKIRTLLIVNILLILVASLNTALGQKESEPETLIKSARFLEEKPLDKKAKDVRQWAITWIIATDKVHVQVCSNLITNIPKKYKYETELFGQYTIGMAAFKLANPDKANDEDAAQFAGVESTIATYQAILKEQPKAQEPF